MGFLVFIVLMLPVMALYALADAVLSPFSGVLGPFLDWLSDLAVFYAVVKALLAVNALVTAALLAARFRWKRAGKLERDYIHSVQGWRRLWRWLVKLVLTVGLFWEIMLVIFFIVLLVTQIVGPMP